MVETTQITSLRARVGRVVGLIRTRVEFVVEGVVQVLHESVVVLAVQLVRTPLPGAFFIHVWTLLSQVVEKRGRPPQVLLAVRVVAVSPFMFLVNVGAEGGLVGEKHEIFEFQLVVEAV